MRPPRRDDALIAAALAVPSLVQVLVAPIAPRGRRRARSRSPPRCRSRGAARTPSRPRSSAPRPGRPHRRLRVLGYVAAFLLFYSLGAHDRRRPRASSPSCAFGARRPASSAALRATRSSASTSARSPPSSARRWSAASCAASASRPSGSRPDRALERERERTAHARGDEERARIARELHDVVAHGLSVIAIQADAAEAALDRDPELARAPLRAIRALGAARRSAEMRRLLGVLRDGRGRRRARAPARARRSSTRSSSAPGRPASTVTLERRGDAARRSPPALDLSAYRIVQEALTNVPQARRAARPPTVTLAWRADAAARCAVARPRPGRRGDARRAAATASSACASARACTAASCAPARPRRRLRGRSAAAAAA